MEPINRKKRQSEENWTVVDGIDIRIILDVKSQLTMNANEIYTDQGALIEEKLEAKFYLTHHASPLIGNNLITGREQMYHCKTS